MSEKKYKIQDFVSITPSELLPKVKNLKTDGYRLGYPEIGRASCRERV
mgnify:CR=1 FL=1